MKGRSIAAVAFALFVSSVILPLDGVFAQQVEIHPRVGSELDDEERR